MGWGPVTVTGTAASLSLREASPSELERWDDLVQRFENHRVVHRRAWIEFLEAAGDGSPLYLVFERAGEVVACLPGLLVRLGPLRLYGSPLPGWQTVSMGPAFDPARVTTRELVGALLPFLERRHGVHHAELMGYDLDPEAMIALGFRGEMVPTYRTRMHPGDEATTLKALKDSARRNIKRARKLGLEVRFEDDERFVDEHYEQVREVYVRGGNTLPFGKRRILECFRRLRAAGNLLATSVYLPDGQTSVATGMFTVEANELLLWTWAHRTAHRWYRPTELMTWTVMQRAMAAGCNTFDFMGIGEFKTKLGAQLDDRKYRWVRSRYHWLTQLRDWAQKGFYWQQRLRGRLVRLTVSRDNGNHEEATVSGAAGREGEEN
jgi:CelD/BcsL family acetyltransferase involved in cellulose biosynthesis